MDRTEEIRNAADKLHLHLTGVTPDRSHPDHVETVRQLDELLVKLAAADKVKQPRKRSGK